MAHPSLSWTAAIDVLTEGREMVSQLGAILPTDTDRSLVDKISDSISKALVALKSGAREEKSKNSDTKKRKIESAQKGRPRKRTHSGSCTRITTNVFDDGHSWRKYGQKNILNLKFPRCYFRCTNKFDQNCPAMRQVQQSEEDESLYVITYFGEHTCQSRQRWTASLTASSVEKESPCIINFGSASLSEDREPKFPSPSLLSSTTLVQVESCGEGISSTLNHGSSSSEYFAVAPAELQSTLGAGSTHLMGSGRPEHSDVTSCLHPSKDDLLWDSELDYLNFTDLFSFD